MDLQEELKSWYWKYLQLHLATAKSLAALWTQESSN
jgi:hypothetical protein